MKKRTELLIYKKCIDSTKDYCHDLTLIIKYGKKHTKYTILHSNVNNDNVRNFCHMWIYTDDPERAYKHFNIIKHNCFRKEVQNEN